MKERVKAVVAFMKDMGVTKTDLDAYFDSELKENFRLIVDDVFNINGPLVTGIVESGYLCEGMDLVLSDGERILGFIAVCRCVRIEKQSRSVYSCKKGDRVAIKLDGPCVHDVRRGMVLTSE